MSVTGCVLLILMIGCVASAGGGPPRGSGKTEAEKTIIARVIHDSICWALTKDRALQESTMAHDEGLKIIWTHSDLNVSGWKQYVKLFDVWMDPRFKATLTEIRDLQIHLSHSGDVAWFSAALDDLGEWDGKPTGSRDIRWTGVLEKRNGKWVFMQMHGSVAADKAQPPARRE